MHPGWVQTGNGQAFAESVGVAEPPMGVRESVEGVLGQVSVFFPQNLGMGGKADCGID